MKSVHPSVPEVSIVIPAYNSANFLGEALDSVFSQTYRNFEVLVIDDASTDETASLVGPLVEQGLIRYIRQDKLGVSEARNRGILEAKGRYIAFLDSDDILDREKLGIQVKYLQEHPEVGLVHSGFSKFDDAGNDLGYRDLSWFSGMLYPRILLYWTTLMAIDTVVVPREVLRVVGLFDTTLRMGEDLDLWRRIARKYPFGFIDRSLARVRVHSGNTSADKLKSTQGLSMYLENAFRDDPGLSRNFRRRAFSRMFSTIAYNLLSENGDVSLRAARLNARRAILADPANVNGYLALLSSLFGQNLRQALIHRWRLLRSRFMSRNRSA